VKTHKHRDGLDYDGRSCQDGECGGDKTPWIAGDYALALFRKLPLSVRASEAGIVLKEVNRWFDPHRSDDPFDAQWTVKDINSAAEKILADENGESEIKELAALIDKALQTFTSIRPFPEASVLARALIEHGWTKSS
jgi:hypothetical protein